MIETTTTTKIGCTALVLVAFGFAGVIGGCSAPPPQEQKRSTESGLAFDGAGDPQQCGNDRPACPASEYCQQFNAGAEGPDLPGVCAPKRAEGGHCLLGGQIRQDMCGAGLLCWAAGTTGYCLPPRYAAAGEYCEGNAGAFYQCDSGLTCNAVGTCEADAPPPPPPPPAGPSGPSAGQGAGSCAGFNDASYCGLNYIRTGDPNILYTCRGGQLTIQEVCANGCNAIRGPQNDHCL